MNVKLNSPRSPESPALNYRIIIGGVLLAAIALILTLFSSRFDYSIPVAEKPIFLLILILMISGAVYLMVVHYLLQIVNTKVLIPVLTIGLIMRVVFLFSTPILEADYYRYLWDGAVSAHGINPYRFSPAEVLAGESNPDLPLALQNLADESGTIIGRINHPQLRTIYPPVSQLFFTIAHFISPWSISGWRLVLLLTDLLNLFFLFHLLKYLNFSPLFLIVYWWNPLLVKEIFNSGHMDILIFPFVLGAIYFSAKKRAFLSVSLLALAMGVKLWPILLLPLLLRPFFPQWKKILSAFLLFGGVCGVIFLPQILTGLDRSSGLFAYTKSWENNDSFFVLLGWLWQIILPVFKIHPGYAQLAARLTTAGIMGILIIFLTLRTKADLPSLLKNCLIVISALFLISPTQFPWYFVWLLPFLTIVPNMPLLLFTLLLPLYYLNFYFEQKGLITVFNNGIVWLEFVPVWLLLLWQWIKSHRDCSIILKPAETE
ncbi:MAG: glycosyltransferase 87 family protein [Calditrichia bacterium]